MNTFYHQRTMKSFDKIKTMITDDEFQNETIDWETFADPQQKEIVLSHMESIIDVNKLLENVINEVAESSLTNNSKDFVQALLWKELIAGYRVEACLQKYKLIESITKHNIIN